MMSVYYRKLRQKAAKNAEKNDKDASKTISMELKPMDSTKIDAEPKQQQQQPEPPVKWTSAPLVWERKPLRLIC